MTNEELELIRAVVRDGVATALRGSADAARCEAAGRSQEKKAAKPLSAYVTVFFRLGDDGVLTIEVDVGGPEAIKLSGTDHDALFRRMGPELGRFLLARHERLSSETAEWVRRLKNT